MEFVGKFLLVWVLFGATLLVYLVATDHREMWAAVKRQDMSRRWSPATLAIALGVMLWFIWPLLVWYFVEDKKAVLATYTERSKRWAAIGFFSFFGLVWVGVYGLIAYNVFTW